MPTCRSPPRSYQSLSGTVKPDSMSMGPSSPSRFTVKTRLSELLRMMLSVMESSEPRKPSAAASHRAILAKIKEEGDAISLANGGGDGDGENASLMSERSLNNALRNEEARMA